MPETLFQLEPRTARDEPPALQSAALPCSEIVSCIDAGIRGVRLAPSDPALNSLAGRYAGGGDHGSKEKIRIVDAPILALGFNLARTLFIALGDCWCTGYPTNRITSAAGMGDALLKLEQAALRADPFMFFFASIDESGCEGLPGTLHFHGHATQVIRFVPSYFRDGEGSLRMHDEGEAQAIRADSGVNALSFSELQTLFFPPGRGAPSAGAAIGLDMYLDMVREGQLVDIGPGAGAGSRCTLAAVAGR